MASVHVGREISVVLPVRNARATLACALKSTLRSRGVALEVLVLDHGSTDGSMDVVARVADPRVRVIEASDCATLADVLNRATSLASTDIVARMDADDVMHPLRLAEDVAHLADPRLAAVCSRAKLIDARSDGLRAYVAWQNACLTPEDHRREVWIEQPLCQPATTFRRAALAGGYRAGAFPEDYDLFLRMLAGGASIEKRPAVRHGWREHERTVRFDRDVLARMKAAVLASRFLGGGRRVIVAGAGKEGRRIARALSGAGAALEAFVDVDPAKIGRTRQGVLVRAAGDLAALRATGALLVAAVGTSGARGVVRAQIAAAGWVEGVDAVVVA